MRLQPVHRHDHRNRHRSAAGRANASCDPGGSLDHKRQRILAVASGGGHWVQLRRLLPAFEGHSVTFVTVDEVYRDDVPGHDFVVVSDATRWQKWALVRLLGELMWIMIRKRPHVVVSTGAAPGCLALMLGRMIGAKTIWLDSLANVEQLSMSGQLVRRYAGVWLTQWENLDRPEGPRYWGSVL